MEENYLMPDVGETIEANLNLQWFPGHMTKTRRMITENLKLVDIVAEIVDARIPRASRNPMIDELLGGKPRVIVLNKSDLADPAANREWIAYYKKQGIGVVPVNCNAGKGFPQFQVAVRERLAEKLRRNEEKGMHKAIRMMVVGIPNVGKSSFINRLAGDKKARVEDRPGVTRSKQWIYTPCGFQLLDTPGILWPKFEDRDVALNLAFTGAIRDDITDVESVAAALLLRLSRTHADALRARYKIEIGPDMLGYDLLEAVGRRRGFLISGGEIDTERAARIVLDEFRGAVIGKITLEMPEETR